MHNTFSKVDMLWCRVCEEISQPEHRDTHPCRIEALERELVQRQDVVNRALQAHNDMRQKQAELLKDFDVSPVFRVSL